MLRRLLQIVLFSLFAAALSAQLPVQKLTATKSFKTLLAKANTIDSLQLIITVKDGAAFQKTFTEGRIVAAYLPAQTFVIHLPKALVSTILNHPTVVFIDALRQPKEELTTGNLDITLNKLNYSHHLFPHINGQGIKASVKEQQFDSTDIDFWGRYFNSGVAAASSSSHASIMATILGGGGNTSPRAIGAAPGVQLTSSSFASLLPDADGVYKHFGITVQNHSYGTDIENYYGADSRAYDVSVLQNKTLVHVFSTGNRGNGTPSEGAYKGVEGMANLTGSFKMAKNVLTVGAIDSFNQIMTLSSRGPAYDGRIKPELVAFGQDGSSGAAALVSGAAALVQQAYQYQKNTLPAAALVRAVLVNSAEDKGPAEVDYPFGFGSLNAYKAVNTVLQGRYFESETGKSETKHFTINVPEGIAQLKITLAWDDPAAEAAAAKALVNDLDLSLHFNGQAWQPWILSSEPSKSALTQPATRGKDTLNNIEQITLKQPAAGIYTISISGEKLQTGQQEFSLAYQFDTAHDFVFTYPTASNPVPAGSTQLLRWQSTFSEDAVIEFAPAGSNWQGVATVDAQKGFQTFKIPELSGKMLFRARLLNSNATFVSDTILVTPQLNMQVGLNCTDSIMLYWTDTGADRYQLYKLGTNYMEPFVQTGDTTLVVYKTAQPGRYFAVAPMLENKVGYRSNAIDYTVQGVACYLRSFFAFNEGGRVRLQLQLGSLYNIQKIEYQVQNSQKGFETFFTDASPASINLQAFDAVAKRGVNQYRAAIFTASGAVVYTPIETVYFFTDDPVIIYPNPARQGEAVRILAQDIDIYSIQVIDATGRTIFTKKLEEYNQSIPPMRLSKGVYFFRVWSDEKKYSTQKLIVY